MVKHAGMGGPGSGPAPSGEQRRRTAATGPKHALPTPARDRRTIGLVVVAGIVIAVITTVAVVVATGRPDSTPQVAAAPEATPTSISSAESLQTEASGTTASAGPTTSLQATPSTPGGTVPAQIQGRLAAALPESGPGLTEPGIALIASPTSDGSFDVIERILLRSPADVLTLRPAPVELAGQQFAAATAAATQVQVTADELPIAVPGAEIEARLDLPVEQVDRFELRYRLTDVTVRSNPSTTGRALAAIGPLTGDVDDDLPVLFILSGSTVLGLNCPLLPLAQQACGSRSQAGPSIEHELPWSLALTSVQFNVPQS